MANTNLTEAKRAKNDEFYTQLSDIEREMIAYIDYNPDVFRGKTILLPCDDPEWSNFTQFFVLKFEELGIKKLISTSYAHASNVNKQGTEWEPTDFEINRRDRYKPEKSATHGKIFTLDRDVNNDGRINFEDLDWEYLEGDGDFRSPEVTALRDEADIIITNPPFSLFREFLAWIMETEKQFIIIGNMNAITYKEVFPLIKENKLWLGVSNFNRGMYFLVNDNFEYAETYKFDKVQDGKKVARVPSICWFTNIEHGRRHEPLIFLTMENNLRFNKDIINKGGYKKYDNYDAIEVPCVNGIPKDYDGIMGVPISFLDKYCPEQFEIIGRGGDLEWAENECEFFTPPTIEQQEKHKKENQTWRVQNAYILNERGKAQCVYQRIFIRHRQDFIDKDLA